MEDDDVLGYYNYGKNLTTKLIKIYYLKGNKIKTTKSIIFFISFYFFISCVW